MADDFAGDGYLDVVVSTWDTKGQLRFFRNSREGSFSERTDDAGLRGLSGNLNMIQADSDKNGDGTFTDVTFAVGLGEVHYPTQTASWDDYDNDGDLDLLCRQRIVPAAPGAEPALP